MNCARDDAGRFATMAPLAAVTVKTCNDCWMEKPIGSFRPSAEHRAGVTNRCRDCESRRANQWNRKNPERFKANLRRSRLKRYGLSPAQYDAMFSAQGSCCAICHGTTPGGQGGFHVDHDHATGRVRGILCNRCNTVLGRVRDDVALLAAAIDYLKRSLA